MRVTHHVRRLALRRATLRPPYHWALAWVTAAGALLRLAWLGRQPIGYDEDFTAVVVHQPLGLMLEAVSRDSAPPLFYVAERAVVVLAERLGLAPSDGSGDAAVLRLIPALAGIALIPVIAALARRVGGDAAGIGAALVVAFSPATVLLSTFARMYSPAALLTAVAALLLWRAIERPGLGRWAGYVAAGVAAAWTVYFSVVALAGLLVAGLWLRPGRRRALVAFGATILGVASIAPWLVLAPNQFGHAGEGFWVPPLGPAMLGGTLSQLFSGPPVDGRLPNTPVLQGLQVAAVLAGFACLLSAAFAWRRLAAGGRRAAAFCLLACSGVAMLAAISIVRPVLEARYASVMWMPLLALAGLGLRAMPPRLAVLMVLAMVVPSVVLSASIRHPETASLMPELEARVGSHDLVAASWDRYLVVLDESGPAVRVRLHALSVADLPWYVGIAAYPAGAEIHAIPADVIANRGRIFWVSGPGVDPPVLPPGYREMESRCATLACLTIFGPADGPG